MHRFVWDLAWGGGESADEDSGYGAPRGPRAVPGSYEIRLTVDGKTLTQTLVVAMDPRSHATVQELEEQLKLSQKIFIEALHSRKIMAEANAVQKQLADLRPKLEGLAELQDSVTGAKAKIKEILMGNEKDSPPMGLEAANTRLASALRVVESSDRAIPAQAVEVYQGGSAAMKAAADQRSAFKATHLPQLNQQLK